jgi:hypoxanthine phosphoribosyltransferase
MSSEPHEEIFLTWHDAGERIAILGLHIVQDILKNKRDDSIVWIVYMLRGGAVVARLLQGFLKSQKIESRYLFFGASYYTEDHGRKAEVEIRGLENLVNYINYNDLIYCIDDVAETTRTYRLSLEHLKIMYKKERPHDGFPPHIKLCVLSWKDQGNPDSIQPDLYSCKDNPKSWLKLPWEWEDHTPEQTRKLYGEITAQLCK